MVATGPSADTISNAATVKATAGIDSYAMKLMLGDWVYFVDTVNGQTRLAASNNNRAHRVTCHDYPGALARLKAMRPR